MNNLSIKIFTLYNIYKKKIIIFLVILFILNVLNFFDIINLYNILFIDYQHIFEFKDKHNTILMKIANLFPILMFLIYIYFFGFNKKIFGISFLFFFYIIINIIFFHKILILGCELHVVSSMESIRANLPSLINNYLVSVWAINMDIVNIEYLDLDAVISHLTFDDRISIISKETLEIWFNKYTNQYVVLKDLYIPIQINELHIEKIKDSSFTWFEILCILSALYLAGWVTYGLIKYYLYLHPDLNTILVWFPLNEDFYYDKVIELVTKHPNLEVEEFPTMELALSEAIKYIESGRDVSSDPHIDSFLADPIVKKHVNFRALKYCFKVIYWLFEGYDE